VTGNGRDAETEEGRLYTEVRRWLATLVERGFYLPPRIVIYPQAELEWKELRTVGKTAMGAPSSGSGSDLFSGGQDSRLSDSTIFVTPMHRSRSRMGLTQTSCRKL
jgi:hypothetical protein